MNQGAVVRLVRRILDVLELSRIPDTARYLEIVFTDDEEIAELNHEFRGKSGPTDILSFSHVEDRNDEELPFPSPVLGSLVLSLDTLSRQASSYQVSLGSEVFRLIVHGLLHLLGYEHEGVSAEVVKEMEEEEDRIAELLSGGDLTDLFS